ncbi:MAG: BatA domain-containing protein [Planctomycetes bacterium]|nr:BatA domain-containing protein [Planctomycetota bacterium]
MLALAFLNPLLLWAVPLCAVPIVIHLLNRRRFRKVPWAAMEFLLAAMKRNRKRLRMEQWLVLLLRTLAVLLLVFLVCRPQFGGGGLLSTKTHHVVVLDDSASMTQRSGSTTLFVKAHDRIRTLVDELATHRSGDLFSLVRTSRPAQPEAWTQRVGPELGKRVGALLKELSCGDGHTDLGAALAVVGKRAQEVQEAGRTEFYVAGDTRALDWATEDDKPKPALLAALQALRPDKDHLTVFGKAGLPTNLAVVDVRLVDRLAVAGVPATLAVDVQNLGLDPTTPSSVAVEVDGQSRVVLTVPQLAPGERVAVPIGHTFHAAGPHRIDAALEASESFPIDDRRTLVLQVREKSRVLLVDGQPDEEEPETFFLQAAMEMAESGIEPMVVTDQGLEETDLAPFDVVWLCNVTAPTAATAKRIEDFVAGGGGLVCTVGPLVDGARWNELLWRDGKGVLPLSLGEIAGDPDRPDKAVLTGRDHPICEGVAEVIDILIGNVVLVKRWLTIVDDGKHSAAIVARVKDAEGPPLLVAKTFPNGGGEVAMFAITADKFWSNLPSTDLFLVLVNQMHRAMARRQDPSGLNLLPDGTLRLSLDPAVFRADATVRSLGGDDERTFTAVEGKEPSAPATLAVPMPELRALGAYEIDLVRHDGAPDKRLVARNLPSIEGRLLAFPDKDFPRLYPQELHDRVTFVREDSSIGDEHGEGEVWPFLAALLLVGLLLESLLAWRFGRR